MPGTPQPFALRRRDLEVLRFACEQYAVRLDQLEVLLDRRVRTAERLARALRLTGLADVARLVVDDPPWLWPTALGIRTAQAGFRPRSPKLALLGHFAAVNEVRLHVRERSPGSVWVCERALARELARGAHLPDAVVHTAGQRHAIEVELTPKSTARVQAALAELCRGYDAVLYYCTPATRAQLERLGGAGRWPKLAIRDLPALSRTARAEAEHRGAQRPPSTTGIS